MTVCSAVLKRLMRSNYLQVFSRNETFWFWDISTPDFPQNVVIGIHSGAALCELLYRFRKATVFRRVVAAVRASTAWRSHFADEHVHGNLFPVRDGGAKLVGRK